MTPQLGRVEDGSAVTAYDEEEVSRRTTMQNAVAFAEWNGVKVNLVDTPGFHMFVHEAKSAMLPVEAAMVVLNTPCGVEAMTDRVWKYADEFNLPRVIVLNQMDHPRAAARVEPTLEALRARYGRAVVPVQLPIANGKGFEGVVDLVTMEAFYYSPGGDGQGKIGEIPSEMQAPAKAAHEALVELVAEGKDELMEEFFAEGTIAEQHLITALHEAIREDRIFPVLFSSGLANVATDHLLDFFKVYAPAPIEREPVAARAALTAVSANGHAVNGPAASGPVVTGDGR
jgi:elongation factor G